MSYTTPSQYRHFERNNAAMQTQHTRSEKPEKPLELPPIYSKPRSTLSVSMPTRSSNPYTDESNYVSMDFVNKVLAKVQKGEKFKDSVFPPDTMIHGIGR